MISSGILFHLIGNSLIIQENYGEKHENFCLWSDHLRKLRIKFLDFPNLYR
jgi:hypothetical protein